MTMGAVNPFPGNLQVSAVGWGTVKMACNGMIVAWIPDRGKLEKRYHSME